MKKIYSVLLMMVCAAATAAPKPDLWQRWTAHDENSAVAVSHDNWDSFLSRYISPKNGVAFLNYGAVTDEDKKLLSDYVNMLAQTAVSSLNKNEQRALWINLYNALTVKTVLDNYPVASIRKISSGFLPTGPWDDKLIMLESEELSLNDIEHRILRPIWQDARLHYAVNCASIGCPNLAMRAYTAQNTEEILEAAAVAYVNHPRGAAVENGKLYVSSIYAWFAEDFGGDDKAVIAHLQKYATGELQTQLQNITAIADDDYDWSLNDEK